MSEITLEEALENHLVAAYREAYGKEPSAEWIEALALRAGTRGPVATLDEAANAIGVTRERVRQVFTKIAPHLQGRDIDAALPVTESLVSRSPVPEPIGEFLSRAGLSRPTLTGPAFLNILRLIGESPRSLVGADLVCLDSWVVEASEVAIMKSLAVANKHTSKYGMTTVEEIRQAIATEDNPLDAADVKRVLSAQKSIKWAGDWLWVEKERDGLHSNRLINTARAILSVNSPQTVESIHQGARRLWRFRQLQVLPSVSAMRTFFDASPYFDVQGDLVSPSTPLDYHEVLGGTTASMIEILKASPYGVMDRQSLHEACSDAGIAAGTYGIWTTYAEWMERFAPNVWGLRGSSPHPGAVEQIRQVALARTKAEPRRKVWSWEVDGRVSQTMDVTTSFLGTGVLSFEPSVQVMVAGQTLSVLDGEEQFAVVKVGAEHSFSWGWNPVISRLSLERGDVLRITVKLDDRTVRLEKGGQELWG